MSNQSTEHSSNDPTDINARLTKYLKDHTGPSDLESLDTALMLLVMRNSAGKSTSKPLYFEEETMQSARKCAGDDVSTYDYDALYRYAKTLNLAAYIQGNYQYSERLHKVRHQPTDIKLATTARSELLDLIWRMRASVNLSME
jgi:hypothetical protein